MYFVFSQSDGEASAMILSEPDLLSKLEEEYWGEDVRFIESLGSDNINDWMEGDILIIKGEIVVPKPKEVVKSYSI